VINESKPKTSHGWHTSHGQVDMKNALLPARGPADTWLTECRQAVRTGTEKAFCDTSDFGLTPGSGTGGELGVGRSPVKDQPGPA